jgi:prevent-host-death family protein
VLDKLQRDREPIVITQNGEARAVLLDVHAYEQSQETLALLQILAHGKKQVHAGETVSLSEGIGKIRAALKGAPGRGEEREDVTGK